MPSETTVIPPNHAHTPTELGRPAPDTPQADFHSIRYQTINARRLEHLASLGLPIAGRSVLEVGAGIGDLTGFFVDRGCRVTTTEGRSGNLALLRARWEDHERVRVAQLDLDPPPGEAMPTHEIVFCYGLLYHVSDPDAAIRFLAESCGSMLLLETQASFGEHADHVPWNEDPALATSARTGDACRPTRPWLTERLSEHFEHVYFPVTRPLHNEFPTAWCRDALGRTPRVIMIASRERLESDLLATEPPAVYADMR